MKNDNKKVMNRIWNRCGGRAASGSARDFLDQHPLSSLLRSDDGTHACIELEMEVGFLEGQVKFTRPNLVSVW